MDGSTALYITENFRRETAFQERFGINVWLGILDRKLVGSFYFPENLTGLIYFIFLSSSLHAPLDDHLLDALRNYKYFQQDDGPAAAMCKVFKQPTVGLATTGL